VENFFLGNYIVLIIQAITAQLETKYIFAVPIESRTSVLYSVQYTLHSALWLFCVSEEYHILLISELNLT